jgi:hypothetical protein
MAEYYISKEEKEKARDLYAALSQFPDSLMLVSAGAVQLEYCQVVGLLGFGILDNLKIVPPLDPPRDPFPQPAPDPGPDTDPGPASFRTGGPTNLGALPLPDGRDATSRALRSLALSCVGFLEGCRDLHDAVSDWTFSRAGSPAERQARRVARVVSASLERAKEVHVSALATLGATVAGSKLDIRLPRDEVVALVSRIRASGSLPARELPIFDVLRASVDERRQTVAEATLATCSSLPRIVTLSSLLIRGGRDLSKLRLDRAHQLTSKPKRISPA